MFHMREAYQLKLKPIFQKEEENKPCGQKEMRGKKMYKGSSFHRIRNFEQKKNTNPPQAHKKPH